MILGITGSIGAGKSTVRDGFIALGWRFFDADGICHEIYSSPAGSFAAAITARWGEGVLDSSGGIDRKKLAAAVFGKPEELQALTSMLYPELERRLDLAVTACRNAQVDGAFEIPLLFENGYESRFDKILCVWCNSPIRYRRLREYRNFTDEQIAERERYQLPADDKLERADFALVNNGSRELLQRQIVYFSDMIREKAKNE